MCAERLWRLTSVFWLPAPGGDKSRARKSAASHVSDSRFHVSGNSGRAEQVEMLEADARAGPPVDQEALHACRHDFTVPKHVLVHETIPGMPLVMLRHANGRRVPEDGDTTHTWSQHRAWRRPPNRCLTTLCVSG